MTFDNGDLTLSLNGEVVDSASTGYSILEILEAGASANASGYIGRSLYSPDPPFRGTLTSFTVKAAAVEVDDNPGTDTPSGDDIPGLSLPYNTTDKQVYGNITLPEKAGTATVTWTTSHPEIVDVQAHENVNYDPTPAGVVTRPEEDTDVTMTATATIGGQTLTETFTFTVKAAPEERTEEDYTDYFFAYFAGEGYANGEQIYFAASRDGLNWTDLKDNTPILTSTLGEKGVRDPYVLRSAEGDKFYIIATDLKIYNGNGWGAAQNAGSQSIMVWESTDLINWSDQRMVPVSASIGAGCTWAPECYYDDVTGEYIVFWASKIKSDNYSKQRVYYAKTRDFYSFTEPEVFIEMNQSSIDTTIMYDDTTDMYYRYTKNEGGSNNSFGARSKTVYAEKAETLLGSWTHIPSTSLNSNGGVEGPAIFKFNPDDRANGAYCLLLDNYGAGGYYPVVTDDLSTGAFARPSVSYKMPSRARHGTPIPVTEEEYKAVMAKWGGLVDPGEDTINPPKEETEDILLHFTFNDTENGFKGGEAVAQSAGQVVKVDDRYAVYFDGSANNWLNVTKEDGSSLLAGVEEMVISFDMKTNGSNWPLYIAPNANQQSYMSEKYIGVMASGDFVVERYYSNNQNRPGFTGVPFTTGEWNHVEITLTETATTIKLNDGEPVVQENMASLASILGDSPILYIGKANWEGGEYFKGYLDNFKIEVLAPVDKTELDEVVKAEKEAALVEEDYTEATWEAYAKALADAEAVLADEDATQREVNAAKKALVDAKDALKVNGSIVPGPEPEVVYISTGNWTNIPLEKTEGVVVLEFDLVPYQSYIDGIVGYSSEESPMTDWGTVPVSLQLGIDTSAFNLRNGGVYENDAVVTYEANKSYHFKFVLDIEAKTYDVKVTDEEGTTTQIADDYSFRDGAPEITNIGNMVVRSGSGQPGGQFQISNHVIYEQKAADASSVIADFNFNAAPAEGEAFDGGNAQATGTYTLVDHAGGKALKLDGNNQFLTVTKKDGTSLLTGLDELSVSFQFNPETGTTNWAFFAAPNADQQTYRSEKYIGIFDNNGAIGAERYNSNSQDRPANPSTSAGYGSWYHVTVVYTADETILYVNGEEAAREASVVDISDLLGDNSILYIGKSTWEGGEYATALIDNYKIYNKALTEGEIAAEVAKYIDRSALEAAIKAAEAITNEEDHTPSTWKTFQDALAAAKEVAATEEITQKDINEAVTALTSAQDKLTLRADMSALTALVAAAKEIKTEGVAEDLVEDLLKEIEDAEKVIANADARQAAVDSAVKQLQKAMDAITEEPDPTPTPDPKKLPYEDVAEADWFYEAVAYTYWEGLMTGMDETHFGPYNQLSRAQFALILYRIEGEPAVETEKSFSDIAGDEWYGQAVLWAAEAGIVSGYLDGNFGPADNITREQMAVMMYRYANYLEEDTTNEGDFSSFKDAESVSEFAVDAMKWATEKQIITGKEEGTVIDPQGETARAEAAAIIQRFTEK